MDYPYSMNIPHMYSNDENHVVPRRVVRSNNTQARFFSLPGFDSETSASSEYLSENHGHSLPSTSYNPKRPTEVSKDDSKSRFKSLFSPSAREEKSSTLSRSSKDGEHSTDNTDKVKTKLLSMWNNVKNGWTMKIKTHFSKDAVIWLLGQHYHPSEETTSTRSSVETEQTLEEFRKDFYSRLWLTYRREFPSLAGSNLTTDCGWGCMLRSGQMMLAEAFLHHFLGREWRWIISQTRREDELHRKIIQWFGDSHSLLSPFSLHHLVALGESSGKKAGDWYGPASVAHILKQAMEKAAEIHPLLNELCIYVAQDCTVYKQDVFDLCKSENSSNWKGVVIFIPVRLGGEAFNPIYTNCIKILFTSTNCLGIIGGRPKHSLYFIGWQEYIFRRHFRGMMTCPSRSIHRCTILCPMCIEGSSVQAPTCNEKLNEKLIHLDPHFCQEVVDVTATLFDLRSFHCTSPRKMSFSRMDPSCTIGFYCKSDKDFDEFECLSKQVVLQNPQHEDYPIFVVAEGRSNEYALNHCMEWQNDDMLNSWKAQANSSFDSDDDSEEFVVL